MKYTIGNWTVESLTTDSLTTSKDVAVVDLSYATDYTVAQSGDNEVILMNTTGASLEPVELVRYAQSKVADIYAGTDIPASARTAAKQGVRTLCEVRMQVKATNSVSGDEILLPIKGWMCIQMPTASMITPEAIQYALTRTFGCSLATGSTDATRVTEVARGDLTP